VFGPSKGKDAMEGKRRGDKSQCEEGFNEDPWCHNLNIKSLV